MPVQKLILGTSSGGDTTTQGALINGATTKTTPVDADSVGLVDSAASNVLKKFTWANIKAAIKSYYDSATATLTNKTITAGSNTITGLTSTNFEAAQTEEFNPATYQPLSTSVKRVLTSNVALSHTGTTTETTVFTGTIPANSIGLNGHFEIHAYWAFTNNANNKTMALKFNGTTIVSKLNTAAATDRWYSVIFNRNSFTSQISSSQGAGQAITLGASSGTFASYNFDTTAAITVTATITLATGTDVASLQALTIVAYP